jgi:hypothetical protein
VCVRAVPIVVEMAVCTTACPHALHLQLPALAHVFGDDVPIILPISPILVKLGPSVKRLPSRGTNRNRYGCYVRRI